MCQVSVYFGRAGAQILTVSQVNDFSISLQFPRPCSLCSPTWVMQSKGLRGFGQFMMFGEDICQETISATTFMFNFSPGSFVYFYGIIF